MRVGHGGWPVRGNRVARVGRKPKRGGRTTALPFRASRTLHTPRMKAIVHTGAGDRDVLTVRDVPRPAVVPGSALIRVRATALNRADVLQRQGRYPAPPDAPPDIPGLEFAGEIEQLVAGATRWSVGDRVYGITGGGAHAEYVCVPEATLAPIPASLSWIDAA